MLDLFQPCGPHPWNGVTNPQSGWMVLVDLNGHRTLGLISVKERSGSGVLGTLEHRAQVQEPLSIVVVPSPASHRALEVCCK